MALAGTHIRLALDFETTLKVVERADFLSGTIYPDSRYVTKVDRPVTHGLDFGDIGFAPGDDFKKGWMLHVVCDRAQMKVFRDLELFNDASITAASDAWVLVTVMKVLQDMSDAPKFSIRDYLPLLSINTPNGEKAEDVLRYTQTIQQMYLASNHGSIQSYAKAWKRIGLENGLIGKLVSCYQKYQGVEEVQEKISRVYARVRDLAQTMLKEQYKAI